MRNVMRLKVVLGAFKMVIVVQSLLIVHTNMCLQFGLSHLSCPSN